MRVRLAAVAAALFALATALPALAQTADATAATAMPAGPVENVIPIGVWIWILVGTGIATVGFAAFGSTIGNGKR
jgi:hypothetical protein